MPKARASFAFEAPSAIRADAASVLEADVSGLAVVVERRGALLAATALVRHDDALPALRARLAHDRARRFPLLGQPRLAPREQLVEPLFVRLVARPAVRPEREELAEQEKDYEPEEVAAARSTARLLKEPGD